MLRDNLVELIEPMRSSAGADPLTPGIHNQRQASDDSLSCLENPPPEGAKSSLTEDVTSPFPAEPRQVLKEKSTMPETKLSGRNYRLSLAAAALAVIAVFA